MVELFVSATERFAEFRHDHITWSCTYRSVERWLQVDRQGDEIVAIGDKEVARLAPGHARYRQLVVAAYRAIRRYGLYP